jgi:hypothetical protein
MTFTNPRLVILIRTYTAVISLNGHEQGGIFPLEKSREGQAGKIFKSLRSYFVSQFTFFLSSNFGYSTPEISPNPADIGFVTHSNEVSDKHL